MDTHFYSGAGNVIIESCDACELNWLDHGKTDAHRARARPLVSRRRANGL